MALNNREPWRYFEDPSVPNDEAAALLLLREYVGPSFAAPNPDDATLSRLLAGRVAQLERVTKRWFVRRDGTLDLHGTDAPRIWLPAPVIAATQTGAALTTPILAPSITIWDGPDPEDPEEYAVHAGAWEGYNDPRDDPFAEWIGDRLFDSSISRPPEIETGARVWPYGVQNIHVTASWGYLEEDGTTPELIRQALALMCVLWAEGNDDCAAISDRRRGALIAESTQGRSWTYSASGTSAGPTNQREIDQILRDYTRPPEATISRPPRRRGRARYLHQL